MAQLPRTATIEPTASVAVPTLLTRSPRRRLTRPAATQLPAACESARMHPFGSLHVEASEVVLAGPFHTRRIPIEDVVFARVDATGGLCIETPLRVHRGRLLDAATAARLASAIRDRVTAGSRGARGFEGGV